MVTLGPALTTIKRNGVISPMLRVTVPKALIDEAAAKNEPLENMDVVRIWIERTGAKAKPRKNAFGKYNKMPEA